MADYVFSLGLIPVQEWIAQARRSRDLRAGSVFLWHVMAKVLARLERESEVSGARTPSLPEGGFKDLADRDFDALSRCRRVNMVTLEAARRAAP